jgi:hypothetical protein
MVGNEQVSSAGADTGEAEAAPPELADVWVWGVRQVAGVMGPLLLAGRWLVLLFLVVKGVTWWFIRDAAALRDAGIALAIFVAVWVGGYVLSRFAAEPGVPDPTGWLFRRHSR